MAIYKTKTGYQIRFYDVDGVERKKTFRGITRQEAVEEERALLRERDRGERLADYQEAPTFSRYAEIWIEENRGRWKASTLAQYREVLATHLKPAFGACSLNSLTASQARQFLTRVTDAGLSPRRINLLLVVLKIILKAAAQAKVIREYPLDGVKPLKEPVVEIDPLSPPEVEAFLAACPPWWTPYFTVAFYTGARPNELAAVKWGDVDWQGRTLRIRAGRYRGVESTPKTLSSIRDVDLVPQALDALKVQKKQQAEFRMRQGLGAPERDQDYIFTGPDGGFLNLNYLRERVWYPTLTKAGLRRRTFYQTRHSFASNALEAGEAATWVSRMLGHTNTEMLHKVYARWIPNRTRQDGSAFHARMKGQGAQSISAGSV